MLLFFNYTATTEIYRYVNTLSRHDALPILSISTATMSTARLAAPVRIPSEMIIVVAPAGGCGTFSHTIAPLVSPRLSATAPTRAPDMPVDSAGPASLSPNSARLSTAAHTPIRCPQIVLRGDAAGAIEIGRGNA